MSTSSSDVSAGFQFEFYCEICGDTWRTDFKPYRKGQITGWLTRFAFMLRTNSLRNALIAISRQFEKIKADDLAENFDAICGKSAEASLGAQDGSGMRTTT